MRAIIYRRYGDPKKVLVLVKGSKVPSPKANEVLVKIESSSVNAADHHMVRAKYLIVRLILGPFRPAKKYKTPGMDVAGTVQALGAGVRSFEIGDAVVADIRKSFGGGYAEFAVVKVADLVRKPDEVSFAEAATVPISGQAAMMAISLSEVSPGDRVLVNGASGGVGSYAVLIAKALGAQVAAICSTKKAEAVKRWGADEIIDYTNTSIGDLEQGSYDVVIDAACFKSPRAYSGVLANDGRYVLVGGSFYRMLQVKFFGRWFAKRFQKFMPVTQTVPVTENIAIVLDMIAQGRLRPAIQKTIPLDEVAEAIHSLEQRKVVGKIVVENQL